MVSTLQAQAHAGIQGLSAYVPGKPIEELQSELGLDSIIKLASNENPLGTSPAAIRALARFQDDLYRYPDGSARDLKHRVARRHRVADRQVVLGNGSDEVLSLVAQVFLAPGRNAVVSEHAFSVYSIVARAVNAEVREVPALDVTASMPRGHDLEAMLAAVDDNTGVIFLANPNNPTGTWFTAEQLQAFLSRVPPTTVVVLDQAYIEYQTEQAIAGEADWLARYENLVITRTFSKIFGMAGLRVGYGLGSATLVDLLERIRPPFNINMIAQQCALAALDDEEFINNSARSNQEQRRQLARTLDERGYPCLPSQANFLTFHLGREAAPVYDALLHQGVIVRPLASYGLPRHLRVTVGSAEDNQRFLAALDQVMTHE